MGQALEVLWQLVILVAKASIFVGLMVLSILVGIFTAKV